MIRQLFVPASVLVIAWSSPAGTVPQTNPPDDPAAMSVVEKSVGGATATSIGIRASTTGAAPVETTGELDRDVSELDPMPMAQTPLWGDALSALDAVAREPGLAGPETVPLPPHRAIPHAQVCEELASAAENNDLPAPFLIRLIWQESGFNQNAVSRVGAQGVAQFMPETAAQRGLNDPFNPLQAVHASAQLLRDLFHQFGNLGLAAAAYNAGPGRVQKWLDRRSTLPQETRDYVQRITGRAAEKWKGNITAAQIRVPAAAPCQREAGLFAANGPRVIPLPPAAPDLTGSLPAIKVAAVARRTAKGRHGGEKAPAEQAVTANIDAKKAGDDKSASTKTISAKSAALAHNRAQGKGRDKKVRLAEAVRATPAK